MSDLRRTFAALRCETRRALIEKLALGPASVGELARPFAMSGPAISQHLNVLEEAGLVRKTVQGQRRIMSLEVGPLREAQRWLGRQQRFWEAQVESLHDHLHKKRRTRRRVK